MDANAFNQLTFWWSVISSLLALIFLGWDIWQFASARKNTEINDKEKDRHKAQIKIWQHFANGISNSILNITQDKYSTVEDMRNTAKILQPITYGLYKSLNEERLFTDDEIKQEQIKNQKNLDDFLAAPKKQEPIKNL